MISHPIPISIQLYTLREEAERDFLGVLRRVASIGYIGVEPAGLFSMSPSEFKSVVEDLGMKISSSHTPWAKRDNLEQVIEVNRLLGSEYVATGFSPAEFSSLEAIKKSANIAAEMSSKLSDAGLKLVVHNHFWEFERLNGRLKYDIFAELCPDVSFELDTYWAANFGTNDEIEIVRRFASRSPLLHIKDGPMVPPAWVYEDRGESAPVGQGSASLLALGQGKSDIRGILAAIDPAVTRWLVVEQDDSDTDIIRCVEDSYEYLVGHGLAVGNLATESNF